MTSRVSISHRLTALLVLVVLCAAFWQLAFAPFYALWHESAEEVQRSVDLKDRLKRAVDDHQAIAAGQGSLEAYRGDYLPGDSESTAAAALQKLIASIATTHRIELVSAQTVPVQSPSGVSILRIRVVFRGSIDGLQAALHAIETGSPFLFIEKMALRSDPVGAQSTQKSGLEAVRLTANLDIVAARWAHQASRRGP